MRTQEKEAAPRVALVGRPNVGKSTLFNRLTGSRHALVDPTPGLTRDRRYGRVAWKGLVMEIIDTGGLEPGRGGDIVSRAAHEQSIKAIEESALLLVLLDGQEGITASDRMAMEFLRSFGKPCLGVVNKVDGPVQDRGLPEFYELGFDVLVPVSAEHGRGVRDLMDEVNRALIEGGWAVERPGGEEEDRAPEEEGDGPVRLAVIGRPNVGKSSLLNRIVGESRMIVTDVPGTTRDAVDTVLRRRGRREIMLIDTAGIRRRARVEERIEKFSVLKAIDAIRDCHLALIVLDATEGVTDQDKRLIGYADQYGRAGISVFNKWDLVVKDEGLARLRLGELKRAKHFAEHMPHLNCSALTGRHVDRILPMVDAVYEEFSASVNTGRANQVLERALALRSPPIAHGHHLRLYYTTQVASRPPTFLIFTNYPKWVPTQYSRFLANQFRQQLDLPRTPVRFIFRQRERRP